MANKDPWSLITLNPAGLLDTRSVPAEIPDGASRWRENIQVGINGKVRRRFQFNRFYGDTLFDGVYHNHDLHSQGATREPPNLEFEAISNAGDRTLFAATPSTIFRLDETTGYWTKIVSGIASSGYHWKAAVLEDVVFFVNNGTVLYHDLGSGAAQVVPELQNVRHITAARIVLSWSGFVILMNVIQDGDRFTSRIAWSDFKLPMNWDLGASDTLAGKQDLDYGDEILNAIPMGNFVFIYTRRSIWKMTVSSASDATFNFERVYNEPKNQSGCLVFPNAIASDGVDNWYFSQDTIYKFNQFLAAPERDDHTKTDWLHRATGAIFDRESNPLTAMSGQDCESPIMEYQPASKELIISWPSSNSVRNNWTMRAMIDFKTADVDPHGWLCLANFRRTLADNTCNEVQELIGVSAVDWAIKSIGKVLYREFATIGASITDDLDKDAPPTLYYQVGYNSVLRGLMPMGLTDREKIVKEVVLDHETTEQDTPCVVQLRIGNSFKLTDPNSSSPSCAPLWSDLGDQPLSCPDEKTLADMAAANLRPDDITRWKPYAAGRYLFYELTVRNADGTAAIGGDTHWAKIGFDATARPRFG